MTGLMLWLACNDQNLNKLSDPEVGVDPLIVVHPEVLSFGEFSAAPIHRELTIQNNGEATLELSTISIAGDAAASFTYLDAVQSMSLEPTESVRLSFAFEPTMVNNQAVVRISSNDPDNPVVDVPMLGSMIAPMLSIQPNPLAAGLQDVGCYSEHALQLSNVGTAPLTINEVLSSDEQFEFLSFDSLPIHLQPTESETVMIGFTPQSIGALNAPLTVVSNAVNTPTMFTVQGTGQADMFQQSWTLETGPKSDILFSVDLSSSMSDEAEALAQQFNTFITELSNYTADWQVMVVNADHGCNHSGILTPNTPNYASIFSDAVKTGAYDISFTEALLTNVTRGVEKTGAGECNEGFLRPDAQLHIIMLSDECEQSPNPGICGTQWQSYIDRIYQEKGDPNLVRLSSVAGDYPSGCGGTAQFGSGYWESAQITGGVFISICSDWTSPYSLQMLASSSVSQVQFDLDYPPIESSIVVEVDGVPHPDWTFDATTNSVTFNTDAPETGSTVTIEYALQSSCE